MKNGENDKEETSQQTCTITFRQNNKHGIGQQLCIEVPATVLVWKTTNEEDQQNKYQQHDEIKD